MSYADEPLLSEYGWIAAESVPEFSSDLVQRINDWHRSASLPKWKDLTWTWAERHALDEESISIAKKMRKALGPDYKVKTYVWEDIDGIESKLRKNVVCIRPDVF